MCSKIKIQLKNQSTDNYEIRVGTIVKGQKPSYEGFIPIVVMTQSSKYGSLGPYCLIDDNGRIMENIWQFSKVYEKVPKTIQRYSQWDNRVIWNWPEERHLGDNGEVNEKYSQWRKAGLNAPDPIRYPVGMSHRSKALYSLIEDTDGHFGSHLSYIEARKQIYFPVYRDLVKKQPLYQKLLEMLRDGKKLLIIEVDGPRQESLDYYKKKYGVDDHWIDQNSIAVNKENMMIMLNDEKHSFGHGYCLAMTLKGLDVGVIPITY
jgi:hypothetical protein